MDIATSLIRKSTKWVKKGERRGRKEYKDIMIHDPHAHGKIINEIERKAP
jgi:hypothetical protein